jgi:hypothetical protein
MVDLTNIDLVLHAQSGDLRPLADHIENGGAIDGNIRQFLAQYLRGEVQWKPGNKRTWGQVKMESRVIRELQTIAFMMLLEGNEKVSEYAVKQAFLARNEDMNENTLSGYIKKFKERTGLSIVPRG